MAKGCFSPPMDSQVSSTATHRGQACRRVGYQARGYRLHVPPQRGGPHPAVQQGQKTGQIPDSDAAHIQGGYRLAEGLQALPGGYVGRQE